jgi:hypothetical protein
MLPIRRAQHVKKSTRPTVGHKAVKPLTHHPKCIQATVPSASLGSHPGVILHLHQSERLTNRRPRRPRHSICNLRQTTMRDPQPTIINRYLNSNSSLTIPLVAITMLHQARITSLSTLLSLPPLWSPSLSNSYMWHSSILVRRLLHRQHPCHPRDHRRALQSPPQ